MDPSLSVSPPFLPTLYPTPPPPLSAAQHVPLHDIFDILRIDPSEPIPEESLNYLFSVLQSRIRHAKPSPEVAAIFSSLSDASSSPPLFHGKKEKDVLTKSQLAKELTRVLETSEGVLPAVDFLCYNCRDRVRLCDLQAALKPEEEVSWRRLLAPI